MCAFVKETLRFDDVDTSHPNCLSFRLRSIKIFIYVVYRPPSYSTHENQGLIDFLLNSCSGKEVVILGDFNLPSITWKDHNPCGQFSTADGMFVDMFIALGLTQWIDESTFPRSGNVLDLILTSEQDRFTTVQVQPPPPGCDHCSVHCEYVFDTDTQIHSRQHFRRQWHRGQYRAINDFLSVIDWRFEFSHLSAQDAFIKLLSILEPLVDQFIPKVSLGDRHHKVPWKSNPPSSLKRLRKEAWDKYKGLRSRYGRKAPPVMLALEAFQQVNSKLRSFATLSQIEYEKSLIARSKENPKLLHSYIRHKKQHRCSVGPLRLDADTISDDPKEMADCFLEAFSDIHTTAVPDNPAPHQRSHAVMADIDFDLADVRATLSNLDPNSAMGQDGLHPGLLKACATTLSIPLFMIYRQSLQEGALQSAWKSSLVVPIFKKGSRHDPTNYRPVSLTSVSCKSLERIISKELYE